MVPILLSRPDPGLPRVAVLHQGIGCCAGHQGLHEDEVAASRTAVEIDPEKVPR